MPRYLKLLGLFLRVSVQDDAAYRLNFFMHILQALFQLAGELIALWTIFSKTTSLAGWNTYEILVLLGVFRIMGATVGIAIQPNMRLIMEDIREGKLDFVLIKPVNAQFYASTRRFVVWRLADVAVGLMVITFGCLHLARNIAVSQVAAFVVMMGAGILVMYSFWLALATLAFWFTRISNIEMVFWNVFEAGRYPVDIYPPFVRWGLTYIIPLAFLITFPAATLIGRTDSTQVVLAVIVAGGALAMSSLFWNFGLRRYSGASA